jgi:hypothetical protein
MKTCIYLMTWLICHVTVLIAQPPSHSLNYLQKYKDLAIQEMLRTGIPASIILSQALLESGAGQNELAQQANNHFGIQCGKSWTGATHSKLTYNTDGALEPGCFRVYPNAATSFRDHTDLIAAPDRIQQYRILFKLETTDYYGWANGLQLTGFFRGGAYAEKLIRIIEDYGLYRYDAIFYMKTSLPERYWPSTGKNNNDSGPLAVNRNEQDRPYAEYGFQQADDNNRAYGPDLAQRDQAGQTAHQQHLSRGRIQHYGGQLVAKVVRERPPSSRSASAWYTYKADAGFDQDQFAANHAYSKTMLVHQTATSEMAAQLPFRPSLVTKVYHKVTRNETLDGIADKYQTTVRQLIHLNGLKNKQLRQGMLLQVN